MNNRGKIHGRLLCGVAAAAMLSWTGAWAQDASFSIAPQSLDTALREFGVQSGVAIMADAQDTLAKQSPGFNATADAETALRQLLAGTGLSYRRSGDVFVVARVDQDPQSGSAAGDGAEGTVEALIVTAQKREENIQDVPIAISAFTQKDLEAQKIEGGFDLLKAIPNVTFSKNNFTSYNFAIRGIGTKAVSATTDPGVAVSFNNSALLQNRLFEQEYFDIERVEVLRGPQGTLYGRNATAGVINVITAKPDMDEFEASIKGEVGNYQTKRLVGMLNVPIVSDRLGFRLAGSMTQREGYDFNEGTDNPVNGRDLWSTRLTVAFNPTDRIRANVIWERFEEDDDRSRTSKQLCYRDAGPEMIGDTQVEHEVGEIWFGSPSNYTQFNKRRRAIFSQGCLPGSLYDDQAFGTPNGLAIPYVEAFGLISTWAYGPPDENGLATSLISWSTDPYGEMMQSRDLRVIDSIKDPTYQATADVFQLNLEFDITDSLTFYSQTVYNEDTTYSTQDYNRFNTVPIISDTSQWGDQWGPSPFQSFAPGGQFCDPQLGCSDKMVSYDQASAYGEQFGQEFRLQSSFDGPINFAVGANYTEFETLVDYFVFANLLSATALLPPFNWSYLIGENPYQACWNFAEAAAGFPPNGEGICPYVDPNPLESINGEGHNYFRSKNPYSLKSTAAFGELYWNASEALKVTAGLRYTDDRKTFTPYPSQILLAQGTMAGGVVAQGYPADEDIKQQWGEWTGRLGVDWKPVVSFTDDTMVYAFYSRGYKGGGANPPAPGFGTKSLLEYRPELEAQLVDSLTRSGYPQYIPAIIERFNRPLLYLTGVEYERTFEPEFVNAFEVGAKNTLMSGALTANASAFFYDYNDYQVSQIRDRTAVNENFDATIWGLELEGRFSPMANLHFRGTFGYLDTKIGDGEESIDIMNRTQSNPDFVLARSWVQLPSNCIVPKHVVEYYLQTNPITNQSYVLCGGTANINDFSNMPVMIGIGSAIVDENTGTLYDPLYYNGENGTIDIHGGAGITDDLSGNELPNAPHWTVSFGGQYEWEPTDAWKLTFRADAYWQSQSWARVYNAVNDKLHGWYNLNLSAWLEIPEHQLKVEFYAKNVLDKTPITDAFINSDDSVLTTNVFVLDPRLIGLSVTKGF